MIMTVTGASRSIVWAATLLDDGPTGGFLRDGRPLPWQPFTRGSIK
jgi:hypothetical protein